MSRNMVVTVTILVVLTALFAYDLFFVEPAVAGDHTFAADSPPVAGSMTIREVKYDPTEGGRLVAEASINVRSADDIQYSDDAAFSVRTNPPDPSGLPAEQVETPYLITATNACQKESDGGTYGKQTIYKAEARFRCHGVELDGHVRSQEIWYPFDSYTARLTLAGCVNKRGACNNRSTPGGIAVRFTGLHVDPADPGMMATIEEIARQPQSVTLTLKRRFFVRMVSIVLLTTVVLFIGYIAFVADPKDTMVETLSVFGGLWALRSLIVPQTVVTFPTLVDYVILILFCVVFALVLRRLWPA